LTRKLFNIGEQKTYKQNPAEFLGSVSRAGAAAMAA
jgi:hypothetical protein